MNTDYVALLPPSGWPVNTDHVPILPDPSMTPLPVPAWVARDALVAALTAQAALRARPDAPSHVGVPPAARRLLAALAGLVLVLLLLGLAVTT